ncbi:type II secretion system protein GspD [Natronospora cellulosivora (SeqCode)]
MKFKKNVLVFLLLVVFLMSITVTVFGDELVTIKVRDANISDVLLMLTEQSGINLVPDESVRGQITIDLKDVTVMEAMRTLSIAYGYHFDMISDNIYMVSREEYKAPPEIHYENGLLTLLVEDGDVRKILNEISELANININMGLNIQGRVSANMREVPLELGLVSFLQTNGFSVSKSNDIYRVIETGRHSHSDLSISVVDGMVTMDVSQADLAEVLRTIRRLGDLNMVLFGGVRDTVDLKLDNVLIKDTIDMLLSGTRFTYRYEDGIYFIGDSNPNSPSSSLLTTNRVIPLNYLQVETVPQLLPHNFPASNVKVLKEQNAILAVGTQTQLDYLSDYIDKIDQEIPLITVEALIVEIVEEDDKISGGFLQLGNKDDSRNLTIFDSSLGRLTYESVISLPSDFNLRLQSYVNQDMLSIKARPNITTLNGQRASLDVGTSHYYRDIKIDSDGNEETTWQSVSGGVTLDVTPWVSGSGEITLDLRPTVNEPSTMRPGGPPDMNRNTIETSIRVKDGQTIIIGGLIHERVNERTEKVPILGDLPLIGRLFREDARDVREQELVMFITPRVLNLSESLREDMEEFEENLDELYKEEAEMIMEEYWEGTDL